MDSLTFVTRVVDALAWPGLILVVAFNFREEFSAILKSITKFKGPGFELERDLKNAKDIADQQRIPNVEQPQARAIEEAPSSVDNAVADSPIGAVLASWNMVEAQLKILAPADRGLRPQLPLTMPPAIVDLFNQLRTIRNKVAHGDQTVTEPEAREFVILCQRLLVAIEEISDPARSIRHERFETSEELVAEIKNRSAAIKEALIPRTSQLKFSKEGERPLVMQDIGAILKMIDGTTRLLHVDDAELLLNDGILKEMNIPVHFMRD